MLIPARLKLVIGIAASALAFLALAGCTVGPTVTQNREGQSTSNSVLNHVTQTDDAGTTTAEVAGPTDWVDSTPGQTKGHSTGLVPRTALFKDGSGREVSIRSGSDIAASGIEFDPVSGGFKIGSFSTSSSAPLAALGELQDKYQATFQKLSADQKDAIAKEFDAIKTIAPELFSLIAKFAGIP